METTTPNGTTEQPNQAAECTPSKALYMDEETAMRRVKALLGAIRVMSAYDREENLLVDLAELGESIVEDQLIYIRTIEEA